MNESAFKIQPGAVCRVPYEVGGFGGKLIADWVRGAESAAQLFPARSWRDAAREISARQYPRAALAKVLDQSARELNAPEASLQNAQRFADENVCAVVTGQQAGFLGGPLYALHKALTAIKLARQWEREAAGEKRFVPVFWVAGDDHDLAEIDHAKFLGADGSVARVDALINGEDRGRSACDVYLSRDEAELKRVRDELAPLLGGDFVESALNAYAGKSFESAFAALMLNWLGAEGLVVARSSDLRALAAPVLVRNVEDFEEVARMIQRAGAAMQASGYEPGFSEKLRVAPHFFVAEPPEKLRRPIDAEFSREELREGIARQPELFSAAAALRPIVQQTIFPCVASVLGPGEISYWAQLREVCARYGAVWPVIVPRASVTLIDGAGEKAVRKLGLSESPRDIFLDKEELVRRVVTDGALIAKLAARRDAALREFDALGAEVTAAGAGLDSMLEKGRAKINYQLGRIVDRTARAIDERGEAKAKRAGYLAGLVRPKGLPQERVLCAAQFMAKYPDLQRRLLEIIEPEAREHLVIAL